MIPAFCQRCGKPVASTTGKHPFICASGHETWVNPIPVAVCLMPVVWEFDDGYMRSGLAIARRAIEPKNGTWNLIGGHVDDGETVEEAAEREFNEETNRFWDELTATMVGSKANGRGHVMIGMLHGDSMPLHEWRGARLCPENSEFGVLWSLDQGITLGFPLHHAFAEEWFAHREPQMPMNEACYREVRAARS